MKSGKKWVLQNLFGLIVLLLLSGAAHAQTDVNALIDQLGDRKEENQVAAYRALKELGSAAVEPLIEALNNHSDIPVRKNAAITLGMMKAHDALDDLISSLQDSNGMVRWAAAWALGELADGKAVGPLSELLKDSIWTVRMRAAEALGKIGSEDAIPALFPLLKDRHVKVREAAKKAMANIKG